MTAPAAAQRDPLQQQASVARRQISAQMIALLTRLWMGMSSHSDKDVLVFERQAEQIIRAAQSTVISLTGSYLSRSASLAGEPWRPLQLPAGFASTVRQNIDFATEYERPFKQTWTALGSGASSDQALERGLTRLVKLAMTDLQLASTHAARAMLGYQVPPTDGKAGIVGYERVPTSGHPCLLCLVASTQRYHSSNLMPIHPGCQCIVEPIWGMELTPRVISPDLLADIHSLVHEQFGSSTPTAGQLPGQDFSYRDIAVQYEHGELGPVLSVRGQHIRPAPGATEPVVATPLLGVAGTDAQAA